MKLVSLLGSWLILTISTFSAYGFDLQFLKHTAARNFTKQDWGIVKLATRDILENHELGDSVIWDNPDSGSSGELKILKVGKGSGKLCKKLQISNLAKGIEHTSIYVFCKQENGKWEPASTK